MFHVTRVYLPNTDHKMFFYSGNLGGTKNTKNLDEFPKSPVQLQLSRHTHPASLVIEPSGEKFLPETLARQVAGNTGIKVKYPKLPFNGAERAAKLIEPLLSDSKNKWIT